MYPAIKQNVSDLWLYKRLLEKTRITIKEFRKENDNILFRYFVIPDIMEKSNPHVHCLILDLNEDEVASFRAKWKKTTKGGFGKSQPMDSEAHRKETYVYIAKKKFRQRMMPMHIHDYVRSNDSYGWYDRMEKKEREALKKTALAMIELIGFEGFPQYITYKMIEKQIGYKNRNTRLSKRILWLIKCKMIARQKDDDNGNCNLYELLPEEGWHETLKKILQD